jgi:hypothetical protein
MAASPVLAVSATLVAAAVVEAVGFGSAVTRIADAAPTSAMIVVNFILILFIDLYY